MKPTVHNINTVTDLDGTASKGTLIPTKIHPAQEEDLHPQIQTAIEEDGDPSELTLFISSLLNSDQHDLCQLVTACIYMSSQVFAAGNASKFIVQE